jgi:hypothetical protein
MMSDLSAPRERLAPEDAPVSVGSILAGLFAEADRRVAMGSAEVERVGS